MPVSMAADPCWRFRSWDRTVLAKPFSQIVMAIGPPMWIERDISSAQLEGARLDLETRLNQLTYAAEEAINGLSKNRSSSFTTKFTKHPKDQK